MTEEKRTWRTRASSVQSFTRHGALPKLIPRTGQQKNEVMPRADCVKQKTLKRDDGFKGGASLWCGFWVPKRPQHSSIREADGRADVIAIFEGFHEETKENAMTNQLLEHGRTADSTSRPTESQTNSKNVYISKDSHNTNMHHPWNGIIHTGCWAAVWHLFQRRTWPLLALRQFVPQQMNWDPQNERHGVRPHQPIYSAMCQTL